jgi:hypothetical protein
MGPAMVRAPAVLRRRTPGSRLREHLTTLSFKARIVSSPTSRKCRENAVSLPMGQFGMGSVHSFTTAVDFQQ